MLRIGSYFPTGRSKRINGRAARDDPWSRRAVARVSKGKHAQDGAAGAVPGRLHRCPNRRSRSGQQTL